MGLDSIPFFDAFGNFIWGVRTQGPTFLINLDASFPEGQIERPVERKIIVAYRKHLRTLLVDQLPMPV